MLKRIYFHFNPEMPLKFFFILFFSLFDLVYLFYKCIVPHMHLFLKSGPVSYMARGSTGPEFENL